MNVQTTIDTPDIQLIQALDVPMGRVYSWGAKAISYLRVRGGSVCLHTYDYVCEGHDHFKTRVQIADSADLKIKYEG